jgi:hypothetical protein
MTLETPMRFLLFGLIAACAMAQTPEPKPLPPGMRNALRNYVEKFKAGKTPEPLASPATPEQPVPRPVKDIVRVPRTCAIPLKNVLRGDVPPRIAIVLPRSAAQNSGVNPFPMKEVQAPAPSCDDMKE